MTLSRFTNIFDYEDLNFRKEFGERLFLLGLKRGKPLLRMARDWSFNRYNLYYLHLCDEVVIKVSPRSTVRLTGERLRKFKIVATFNQRVPVSKIAGGFLKMGV